MVDQTTPLPPFNDASGQNYWTSNTVRTTEVFSYAYPETQRWRYRLYADYVNNLQATIDQLYGGVSRIFRRTGLSGRGEGLRDSERSASRSIPEATDGELAGEQKTLAENVTPHKTASNDKQESHGLLADIGHSVKKLILGDDDKAEDSTRGGEDFETEIGKGASKSLVLNQHTNPVHQNQMSRLKIPAM